MSAERPENAEADLVLMRLTTTRAHAVTVLTGTVEALDSLAVTFSNRQSMQMDEGLTEAAKYTNRQLGRILEAQIAAQNTHKRLTTQGEMKHGNDA